MTQRNIIRQIYFYAASLITLVMIVISTGQLVDLGLKATLFPLAEDRFGMTCGEDGALGEKFAPRPAMEEMAVNEDKKGLTDEEKTERKEKCEDRLAKQRAAGRQRDLVRNLSMLIVAAPVFWFHFRIAQRERREELESKSS